MATLAEELHMSSSHNLALASLDDCLAFLRASLGRLRAAKSVDVPEMTEQLKMAAESAGMVRDWVWSELPGASWQSREELEDLITEIHHIIDTRAVEQLRSRLLTLAEELKRGSIVHRRAQRVTELNRLRDLAVDELRSHARLEGTPQTLPGPQSDQWIDWACALQEPQDSESLHTIRHRFPCVDDFVANLEPDMWVPSPAPVLEVVPPPSPKRQQAQAKAGADQKKTLTSVSGNRNGDAVATELMAWADAVGSLDGCVAILGESLATLRAANYIEVPEVIETLKKAAESARVVRERIWAELPGASWQSREELNALHVEIQKILRTKQLDQLRARLTALAAELEQGTIVHRRTQRVSELNRLRDQAINELRSQGTLEVAPQILPGPSADQWIYWACALKEPQDTESLRLLREGFPHLDEFIASLEASMWSSASTPAAPNPTVFMDRLDELRRKRPQNYPPTQEEVQAIHAQEHALMASMSTPEPAPPATPVVARAAAAAAAPALAPERPVEHSDPVKMIRESQAAAAAAAAKAAATPAVAKEKESDGDKWRKLPVNPVVIVIAALVLAALVGGIVWKMRRGHAVSTVQAVERQVAVQSNPGDPAAGQLGVASASAALSPTPDVGSKPPANQQEQATAAKPSTKEPSEKDKKAAEQPLLIRNIAVDQKPQQTQDATPAVAPQIAMANSQGGLPKNLMAGLPAPVPAKVTPPAQKLRVSSGVAEGQLIHQVSPKYPSQARQAHIQGTVALQAVIGKDGSVQGLRVLSGPPLLVPAAMEAVKEWRYKPFYLNGEASDADTQINVKFTLGEH